MEKEKRYQTVAELPEWAKPTIQKLVNEGKIADRNKLDLSMDMIRMLTIIPLVSAITMICMRME